MYIDRRKHDLSANYRFATEAEKQIFDALTAQKNQKIIEKQKKETEAMEEEKLCILIDQYIYDQRTANAFLKYCQVECGWINEFDVNVEDFKNCLEHFRNEHPEYAHNINMD